MCNSALGLQMHLRLNYLSIYLSISSGGKDNIGIKLYDNDLQLRKGFADILRLLGKEKDIYCSYWPVSLFYQLVSFDLG